MWASYRSTISRGNSSRDLSSVASPGVRTQASGSARQSLLGKMIETEHTEDDDDNDKDDDKDDDKDNDGLAQAHEEEKKEDDGDDNSEGDGDANDNGNDSHGHDARKEAAY
mmetsp:Transcript_24661/g.54053  ORF Transcript_24661/g.54053 Transcript_24661/m.54053 type:complete len:111 (+) Transcript_24661:584-916(+)